MDEEIGNTVFIDAGSNVAAKSGLCCSCSCTCCCAALSTVDDTDSDEHNEDDN